MIVKTFFILFGNLVHQAALAQTEPQVQHLSHGATTILTPAGEDLGIRFHLMSVMVDGQPIELNSQPEIQRNPWGSILTWHDQISEHWLDIDDGFQNKRMELSFDFSGLAEPGQTVDIEYKLDGAAHTTLIVSGNYNHLINDDWSLNTDHLWIRGSECQRIQYGTKNNGRIYSYRTKIHSNRQRIHMGLRANLNEQTGIGSRNKPFPNRFYLSGHHLVVSDHDGYLSYFNRIGGVFEFKQHIEHPGKAMSGGELGCNVLLNDRHLVASDCDTGKLLTYQYVNQHWQPHTVIDINPPSDSKYQGSYWAPEFLFANGEDILVGYASLIKTFSSENKEWLLSDEFDVESKMGQGHLEGFVLNGNQMVVLTRPKHSQLHIHRLEKQGLNWVLFDEAVLAEPKLSFPNEQIQFSDGILAIPLSLENDEVWVFDTNKKLNDQTPLKLRSVAGTSPKQHFNTGDLGPGVEVAENWMYVYSSGRLEQSASLNKYMPDAVCSSDIIGRVDVWNKQDNSWDYKGQILLNTSRYAVLDLIKDQGQVYMVIDKIGASEYQLIPLNKGVAKYEQSIPVEIKRNDIQYD